MGLAAADAGDPSGGEHMVPALHPHLTDRAEAPPHPPHPLSPWKKPASMAAVILVEGDEDGVEHLIPAVPPLLSCQTEHAPNPLSPCRQKASLEAADGDQHDGTPTLPSP